jgi:hypothetical protein
VVVPPRCCTKKLACLLVAAALCPAVILSQAKPPAKAGNKGAFVEMFGTPRTLAICR